LDAADSDAMAARVAAARNMHDVFDTWRCASA
jgi:hypothetical protein